MRPTAKTFCHALATALTLACALAPHAALAIDFDFAEVRFQIYRIKGSVSSQGTASDSATTPITPNIDMNMARTSETATNEPMSQPGFKDKSRILFSSGDMQVAGHHLEANLNEWKWDGDACEFGSLGADLAMKLEPNILLISQPKIKTLLGHNAAISISGSDAVEYFEHDEADLYRLKQDSPETGLAISLTPSLDPKTGNILLKDFSIVLRSVNNRMPLDGTKLNVGRPIVTEQKSNIEMAVREGKNYAMIMTPDDGQGEMLVRIMAKLETKKVEAKPEK